MPWFNLSFSDFIKKRVCKFLINRYLGQFFEEKLTANQICLDLYNGLGSVYNVNLCCEVSGWCNQLQNLRWKFKKLLQQWTDDYLHIYNSSSCCCFSHSKLVFLSRFHMFVCFLTNQVFVGSVWVTTASKHIYIPWIHETKNRDTYWRSTTS